MDTYTTCLYVLYVAFIIIVIELIHSLKVLNRMKTKQKLEFLKHIREWSKLIDEHRLHNQIKGSYLSKYEVDKELLKQINKLENKGE